MEASGARAILSLAAFYAPEDIPEELFSQKAEQYPAALAEVATNELKLVEAIGGLIRFSLLEFDRDKRTLSIHRLVQAAARDAIEAAEAPLWLRSAVCAAKAAFPEPSYDTWSACERLISHVRAVASQATEESWELAMLLWLAGRYLQGRTPIADVFPLYERGLSVTERFEITENAGWLAIRSMFQRAWATRWHRRASCRPRSTATGPRSPSGNASPSAIRKMPTGSTPSAPRTTRSATRWSYRATCRPPSKATRPRSSSASSSPNRDSANPRSWRDLSFSHNRIGGLLVKEGNLPAALESFKAALAIRVQLAEAVPANVDYQHDTAATHDRIGDVHLEQGNFPAALENYKASLAINDRLVKTDPAIASWQHDLSVSHNKLGKVLKAQGNLAAALESFKASLAISGRLAKTDSANVGWQLNLTIPQDLIGDVLLAQSNLCAAQDSYKAALAIRERLAKTDPGNAMWQHSLFVSHSKIGEVLLAQASLPGALDSFSASLTIIDRLSEANPGNADWRRHLALARGRVGMVQIRQGNRGDGLKTLRDGRDIIAQLLTQAPDNARLASDLSWLNGYIAEWSTQGIPND